MKMSEHTHLMNSYREVYKRMLLHGRWMPSPNGRRRWYRDYSEDAIKAYLNGLPPEVKRFVTTGVDPVVIRRRADNLRRYMAGLSEDERDSMIAELSKEATI